MKTGLHHCLLLLSTACWFGPFVAFVDGRESKGDGTLLRRSAATTTKNHYPRRRAIATITTNIFELGALTPKNGNLEPRFILLSSEETGKKIDEDILSDSIKEAYNSESCDEDGSSCTSGRLEYVELLDDDTRVVDGEGQVEQGTPKQKCESDLINSGLDYWGHLICHLQRNFRVDCHACPTGPIIFSDRDLDITADAPAIGVGILKTAPAPDGSGIKKSDFISALHSKIYTATVTKILEEDPPPDSPESSSCPAEIPVFRVTDAVEVNLIQEVQAVPGPIP